MCSVNEVSPAQIDRLLQEVLNDREPESYLEGLANITCGSNHFMELVSPLVETLVAPASRDPKKSVQGVANLAFNLGWRCRDLLDVPERDTRTKMISLMHLNSHMLDQLLLAACHPPEPEANAKAAFETLTSSLAFMSIVSAAQEPYGFAADCDTMVRLTTMMATVFNIGWKCRDGLMQQQPEWTQAVKLIMNHLRGK
jgi:hypothetical protein